MSRFSLGGLLAIAFACSIQAQEAKVFRQVGPEKIEGILAGLKIDFKKADGKKPGFHYYDFERQGLKVRLHNYGGKDLWIEALFTDKISLEDINRFNQGTRFSRAVLLKDDNRVTISLEAQLDCLGGVTDAVIRQFILRFDGELKGFVSFLSK